MTCPAPTPSLSVQDMYLLVISQGALSLGLGLYQSQGGEGAGGWTPGERRRGRPQPPPLECTHPSTFRIVDEVRSIRFNQEQEEELLQRRLSWNISLESKSSVDIREMTREQDLITALVNRKKVQLLSFPLLPNQCSPLTSPSPATTPLVKVSDAFPSSHCPSG